MPEHASKLRRVALIINAQVSPRRRMLAGVARYTHEHVPWAIHLKPFGVEEPLATWARRWDGDGIISAVASVGTAWDKGIRIPVVDLIGSLHSPEIPLVHANDHSAGRMGAEHLLERGFRQFGFVGHEDSWATNRRSGFEQVVASTGGTVAFHRLPHPSKVKRGPGVWEAQQRKLLSWIQSLPKPVGIMTATDLIGQQLLEACQRDRISVPDQVAVVGVDNDDLICNICSPPLSSVFLNDEQRGYEAAAMLDRLMSGMKPPTEPVYIEPSGVVSRASTDIMAIDDEALSGALRFLRDRACDAISVDDVVRAVPLSRSVLERRFRKAVGRTMNDEIVRLRINRAVELLSSTHLELKDIAIKAGFRSPSYMGAVFREKLGRTPGSYRDVANRVGSELVRGPVPQT